MTSVIRYVLSCILFVSVCPGTLGEIPTDRSDSRVNAPQMSDASRGSAEDGSVFVTDVLDALDEEQDRDQRSRLLSPEEYATLKAQIIRQLANRLRSSSRGSTAADNDGVFPMDRTSGDYSDRDPAASSSSFLYPPSSLSTSSRPQKTKKSVTFGRRLESADAEVQQLQLKPGMKAMRYGRRAPFGGVQRYIVGR